MLSKCNDDGGNFKNILNECEMSYILNNEELYNLNIV